MISLATEIRENTDRSHNEGLQRYLFDEVQSMLAALQREESDNLKLKWDDLSNVVSNSGLVTSTLCHEIIPRIAKYRLKKLFDRSNDK